MEINQMYTFLHHELYEYKASIINVSTSIEVG